MITQHAGPGRIVPGVIAAALPPSWRRCRACGHDLPLTAFPAPRYDRRDGSVIHEHTCRTCRAARERARRERRADDAMATSAALIAALAAKEIPHA